jgi:Restriction endonuclease
VSGNEFTDLHDRRFEDLCMQMVYRLLKWEQIDHDGRSGSDAGVDLRAIEQLDDGSLRDWFVQCRRYQKVAAAELQRAVNDTLKKVDRAPEVLLVVVACDVSLRARTSYEKYARKKGIISPYIWSASTLETKLYSDYPDLLPRFKG